MIRKTSMFQKLFIGLCAIITLSMSLMSGDLLIRQYRRECAQMLEKNDAAAKQLSNAFNTFSYRMDGVITSIYHELFVDNAQFTRYFSGAEMEGAEEFNIRLYLFRLFSRLCLIERNITSVYIQVGDRRSFLYSNYAKELRDYAIADMPWYQKSLSNDGRTYTSISERSQCSTYAKPVIAFSRALKNVYTAGKIDPATVILLEFDIEAVDDILKTYIDQTDTCVLISDARDRVVHRFGEGAPDASGEIDFGALPADAAAVLSLPSGKYIASAIGTDIQGMRVSVFMSYAPIIANARNTIRSALVICLLLIAITSVVLYRFVRWFCRPIKSLERGMSEFCAGDFSVSLTCDRSDEIGSLVKYFNEMAKETNRLIKTKIALDNAHREAQYKYLLAQINPHFIFNTLQTVSSMAIVYGVPQIGTVTGNLAKLIRYQVASAADEIRLAEELQNLQCYIAIQQIRFQDRIDFSIDVAEELCSMRAIALFLQPIVENSIVHGIEPNGGSGRIRVTGRLDDRERRMIFTIEDDGVGMTPSQVEAVARYMAGGAVEGLRANEDSVGLRNIQQRIWMLYGKEYGVRLQNGARGGTAVTVVLPAIPGGQEH